MKTLITYTSKYGSTERAVRILAENLGGEVELFNLKAERINKIDLDEYQTVIIGGSIYAGKIQKEVTAFCNDKLKDIKNKKLGLFICCGNAEKVDEYLDQVFGEELSEQAVAKGYFGYEYNFKKMNFFFKMIIKMMAKIKESQFRLEEENIREFADKLSDK